MPRPKKMNSETMIELVDRFFTTEAAGDPSRLKCSLLENFAAQNGYDVKAYDFRRDATVREHMEALKNLARNENGIQIFLGNAYKSLDVERLLRVRRDPDEMRKVLGELDTYWKDVYDAMVLTSRKNTSLQEQVCQLKNENDIALETLCATQKSVTETQRAVHELTLENRYLRKMLKTWLYPAIANQILCEEHLLDQAETQIPEKTMQKMADGSFPSSFSEAIQMDRQTRSREEQLLKQMWSELGGDPEV